jgi:hypothetical protein
VVEQADRLEPFTRQWIAVGDGAIRFRGHLQDRGITVPADDSPLHLVDGGAICRLALAAQPVAVRELMPDYRRRPDAEIALEGANK